MTIGVIANELKDTGLAVARSLAEAVYARGGEAVLAAGADYMVSGGAQGGARGAYDMDRAAFGECDVIICVGGDGTLIKAARETLLLGRPILGVNLGSFGYLTEVETSQIGVMLDRIFDRDYQIEERMMLSITRESGAAEIQPEGGAADMMQSAGGADGFGCRREETALNELAIGRGETPHVVRLQVFVNGEFFDTYPGDGILISTPTGSTAYSLSAGGPVIDPGLEALSIVPVCPHVIFSRPVLLAPDKVITIAPISADGFFKASVSIDGFGAPPLRADEIIKIRRSEHVTKMVRFNADNFYVALKNKLYDTAHKFGSGASRAACGDLAPTGRMY